MKRTVVLVLLSLHCSSLTSCASECHKDGPGECTFYKNGYHKFCSGWSTRYNFQLFVSDIPGHLYSAGLGREAGEGKLTSRTACSTQGQTHCLQFQYIFEQNNVIDLSVSIRYGTDEEELLAWIISSSREGWSWNTANVPVNTTRNFKVVFKATRRFEHLSNNRTVAIDDIDYSKSSCQSGLYPPDAQPTTTTTPKTPMNKTPTSSIKLPASTEPTSIPTAATSVTTGTTKISRLSPLITPSESGNTTAAVIMLTSPNYFEEKHSEEPSNTGIIVGVIVAVLIIIVFISVLLVVYRRKHFHVWKACCRKKQPEERFRMNASHNVTFNLDADDSGNVNGAVVTNTQQNSDNHRLEGRTFTHSLANHSYENTQPNNLPEPVYAANNNTGNVKQEHSPNAQRKLDTAIYEVCTEDGIDKSNAAGIEYQNLPPKMAKQGQGEQGTTCVQTDHAVYSLAQPPRVSAGCTFAQQQNSNSAYHNLEKESEMDIEREHHVSNAGSIATAPGQDGDYNRLNFDTESCHKETNGVYSHLKEGEEDTYNEVHRQKRDEVIDGEYSHIK